MNYVQPIRDKQKIEEIKGYLRQNGSRDLLLFTMGINCGLRVSDLIRLKVIDVKGKSHVEIKEKKTQKTKRFPLLGTLQSMIAEYVKDKGDNEYLFRSRVGANKPITRVMAYMIINEACKKAGINDSVGTHSLRKTFSYHHYQQFHDIVILQSLLNHSSEAQCLRYIHNLLTASGESDFYRFRWREIKHFQFANEYEKLLNPWKLE